MLNDATLHPYVVLVGVSTGYPSVAGMLLTRYAPLRRSPPSYCYNALPLDLHVLSLPLAFILSQDQTLHCIVSYFSGFGVYLSKESSLALLLLYATIKILSACTFVFQ